MYNPQMYVDRLNNQIRELEALKGQIPPLQQPITQNFQLAPSGNGLKYADSIEEVEKSFIVGDTPFFSKDMSVVWIKNNKEIKSYELKEIIQKDEKDLKIEYLEAQIEELKKEVNKDESNANSNESTTNTNQE
jgi:hypothetical protein